MDEVFADRLRPNQAARELGISYARIVQLRRDGILQDVIETPFGHLFSRKEVLALKLKRDLAAAL